MIAIVLIRARSIIRRTEYIRRRIFNRLLYRLINLLKKDDVCELKDVLSLRSVSLQHLAASCKFYCANCFKSFNSTVDGVE